MSKKSKVPGTQDKRSLDYSPSRRFRVNPEEERLLELIEKLPKGLFAILANDNARYTAFHGACAALILPLGSRFSFHTGCYVVDSSNKSVLGMKPDEDWICFMGDDHVFPPEMVITLLAKMYAKNLDIIVPVCFKRNFPPQPVLYDWISEVEIGPINLNKYPDGGLVEVYAAGTAGMVVRRRVFEKMREKGKMPYFELGVGQWGEDLYFCHKAQQLGFKVWADLDMSLGHILNTAIWPVRLASNGAWACQYDFNTQGGFALELDREE